MSNKMLCPACNSYTSTALSAYERGDDCPYCGLPIGAWEAITEARKRHLEGELLKNYEMTEIRATKAEAEVNRLQGIINRIERALKERSRG